MLGVYEVIGGIGVISGIGVIMKKKGVESVVYMIISFVNIAIWLMRIGVEYVGWIIMLVYIGAIAVLFMFVVMMLEIREEERGREYKGMMVIVGMGVGVVIGGRVWMEEEGREWIERKEKIGNVMVISKVMYGEKMIGIIECGMMLMLGMIAVIMMVEGGERKKEEVREQELRRWEEVIRRKE
ncbi:NADH dehydrogenase subunit 6 (mitochondrion) [Galdieria partita]|uniref:NADH-ubiquinone oxidoreductase chain 6 n=1 Tax=Galdieria partita TaxID=83374 RepID=A0A9C7F4B9_9RHOD|nr:NADH dehydrogenase subunit 6 [Galdieria partita]